METFLLIIVGILGLIAIVQAVRVFELSGELRKKPDEESTVTDRDNNTQGILMLVWLIVMMGSFVWMMIDYGDVLLPRAASEHGDQIDNLMLISMGLIIIVFVLTQPLLFGFAYRFRGSKRRKAVYMEHNNRLEFIWTIIPAIVLAGLIIYGLTTWSNTMNPNLALEDEEPMVVELYGKQFSWQARYSGEDNQLGFANVRLIGGNNTLGIDPDDVNALDDIIVNELHLPVNKSVTFRFRSQDVIHSAYLPHFRVQMNVVPGTNTNFTFKPTITTAQMREDPNVIDHENDINEIRIPRGDEPYEFNYVLLCNKICGSAHYNMQMRVVVETQEEFEQWLSEQQTFAEML